MADNGSTVLLQGSSLASDGSGVSSHCGLVTFVPGLLPGEVGKVRLTAKKKNYQRGCLLALVKASPDRTEPPCPVYRQCGGCRLQHLPYETTLYWKKVWLEEALGRIGRITAKAESVLGMDTPWRYRNKALLHRGQQGELGYYEEKTHQVTEFPQCLLLPEDMNRKISSLRDALAVWDKDARLCRKITLRQSSEGKSLVYFEGPCGERGLKGLFADLRRQPLFATEQCSLLYSDSKGEVKGTGTAYLREELNGIWFRFSALSFMQVNSRQARRLYEVVLAWAGLTGKEVVWDLYAGTGTMTLLLAPKAAQIVGVEESPCSVRDARRNIQEAGLANVTFLAGKAENVLGDLPDCPDVVVADPPRNGMSGDVVTHLLKVKPAVILYVSCDPSTLARDAGRLIHGWNGQAGCYTVEKMQPVDMFCWTPHVECVVLITRKDG